MKSKRPTFGSNVAASLLNSGSIQWPSAILAECWMPTVVQPKRLRLARPAIGLSVKRISPMKTLDVFKNYNNRNCPRPHENELRNSMLRFRSLGGIHPHHDD